MNYKECEALNNLKCFETAEFRGKRYRQCLGGPKTTCNECAFFDSEEDCYGLNCMDSYYNHNGNGSPDFIFEEVQ